MKVERLFYLCDKYFIEPRVSFFFLSLLLLLSTNFFLFLFIIEIILYPRNDGTYCVLVGRVLFFINYLHLIANVVRVLHTHKKEKNYKIQERNNNDCVLAIDFVYFLVAPSLINSFKSFMKYQGQKLGIC